MNIRSVFATLAAAVALFAGAASGQLEVRWNLAHSCVALLGPMEAQVRVTNLTGEELVFGPDGNASLAFWIDDGHGGWMPGNGRSVLRHEVRVPNGATGNMSVDISDGYTLLEARPYMVAPVVDFEGSRFTGTRRALEVQPGMIVAELKTGLASRGTDREASFRQIHRDGSWVAFFRLDAPSAAQCLGVYELGNLIHFVPPALMVDAEGNWHTLHQSAPDRFMHSVFTSDGSPVVREVYLAQAGAIRLERDDRGDVFVEGGTPFQVDPANPGKMVAPALPPTVPFRTLEDATPERAEKSSWWR